MTAATSFKSKLLVLLPLLVFAACTDSVSDVGVQLLGTEFGPGARSVEISELETSGLQDYTGGLPRVLVGRVDDPLAGIIDATAYVGFSGGFTAGDTSSIVNAELVLSRSYLYGDTSDVVTLDIFDLAENWDPTGLQADTVLMSGDWVTTVTFAAADTQVTATLPVSWIDANSSIVKSADVDSLFHGFKLVASQGNAVVGYRISNSGLRFTTTTGTNFFDLSQTFTGIQRTNDPMLPDNTIMFQDGAGPVIKLNFELSEFDDMPINGVVVTVPVDTVEGAMAPPGFLRPQIRELQLVAVPEDTSQPATFLAQATLNSGVYRFLSVDLTTYLQRVLVGTESFAYLEIRAPVPDNSLDVALLHNNAASAMVPEAQIILSQ